MTHQLLGNAQINRTNFGGEKVDRSPEKKKSAKNRKDLVDYVDGALVEAGKTAHHKEGQKEQQKNNSVRILVAIGKRRGAIAARTFDHFAFQIVKHEPENDSDVF